MSYNLIILEDISSPTSGLIQALKRYTEGGGNLLIIPSKEVNLTTFKNLATALNFPEFTKLNTKKIKVSKLNKNHILFKDVFEKQENKSEYPSVNSYYSLAKSYFSSEENILLLNTKESFLSSKASELDSFS